MDKKSNSEKDYTVQVSGFGATIPITIKWFFSSDFKDEAEALKAAREFYESTYKDLTHGCEVFIKVINWKGGMRERVVCRKIRRII